MALTTISDTLYAPNGTLLETTIVLSWSTFTSFDGHVNPAGSLSTDVVNGKLLISLEPNDTATPSGTSYTARYSGSTAHETWVVPTSGSPIPLSAVRVVTPPTPSYLPPAFVSIPGVWDNTAWADAGVASVNGGDPKTMYQMVDVGQFTTNGFSSAVIVPVGATEQGANSFFAGIVNNSTGCNAVGYQSFAFAAVNNAHCWAANFLVQDAPGLTGVNFFGIEMNHNINSVATHVAGIIFSGASTVNPSSCSAMIVNPLGTGIPWQAGLASSDAGCSAILSVGKLTSGVSQSQVMQFNTTDGGSVNRLGQIFFNAAGELAMLPSIFTNSNQFIIDINGIPRAAPRAFSALPAASSALEGSTVPVTDSNTAVWGAVIAGGGANHVLAYCTGSAWHVAAA